MKFIVIEGIDGSGKSTLINSIEKFFISNNIDYIKLFEPTSGEIGKKIRKLLKGEALPDEQEILDLFIEDRKIDVEQNINPAIEKNKVILMDRYYYSNVAYQGAMGIDPEYILKMNRESHFPEPDRVYLLDLDPKVSLERVNKRSIDSNIEKECFEKFEFLNNVRTIFLNNVSKNFLVLNAEENPEKIFKKVEKDLLDNLILDKM